LLDLLMKGWRRVRLGRLGLTLKQRRSIIFHLGTLNLKYMAFQLLMFFHLQSPTQAFVFPWPNAF